MAVLAVALAMTLFGVPLAVAVHRLAYGDERGELERQALAAAVAVSPDSLTAGDPVELPATEASVRLAVYDRQGRRITGDGPALADIVVDDALRGTVADSSASGDLVVAVPISSGERVIAVARAAAPVDEVRWRVLGAWAALLGLGLLAGGCASVFAAVQARRLTRPLDRLTALATDLGAGDFTSRAVDSGVAEIDRAGRALNRTAERLDDLLARERAFSAHASHQLRTPLTGLRLELESALAAGDTDLHAAVRRAIAITDQLSETVDDVLALARPSAGTAKNLDLGTLMEGVRLRWHGTLAASGRALRLEERDPPPARAEPAAVRQIVDVLVDNAYRHGRGTVTLVVRSSGDALAVDVVDEGHADVEGMRALTEDRGSRPDASGRTAERHGLGLALARVLAEGEGGRLVFARTEPLTRMTLLLPAGSTGDPPVD